MTELPDPWPLWGLELRTPRLVLRPDDDAGLVELLAEACHGVHLPAEMPFGIPWTEAPPEVMVREGLKFHWSTRVGCRPDNWGVCFLVRHEGKVIGSQELRGKDFAVTREVSTGSWIGLRHQGKGLGTEMRAAVLMLAFDYLGTKTARSDAFQDNVKSHSVSRKLGYQPDGTWTAARRGVGATHIRLAVTAEQFAVHRPNWQLDVRGLAPAQHMFGL